MSNFPPLEWQDPARRTVFEAWLADIASLHALDPATVRPASADASFRRYFRIDAVGGQGTRVLMDAPPAHENCHPFVEIADLLIQGGVNAPQVLNWDEAQGFMLLSDLGDETYLHRIETPSFDSPLPLEEGLGVRAKPLYLDALDALIEMQKIPAQNKLPPYDRALLQRELDLFPEWFIQRHHGHVLSDADQTTLKNAFDLILANNLAQPCVFVHRDFHSRNLMISSPNPGVLDFQDAVWGPITYDLASLLRDAYIEWDEDLQIDYAVRYWEKARAEKLPVHADFGAFWRDFEWMGLQRHLKVLGIFARLYHRDGKNGYLKNLPLVWKYAHRVCTRYTGLGALAALLETVIGQERAQGWTF